MIIGLNGLKQSGKSTIAEHLMHKRFGTFAFADPLKNALAAMGVPRQSLWGPQEEKEKPLPLFGGKSGRYLMQTLGTEWGREMVDPDLWVNIATNTLSGNFVCSDVRFPNEAKAIHDRHGLIIKVIRPSHAISDGHKSEQELPDSMIDIVIMNTGTMEELLGKVDAVLDQLRSII